MGLCQIKSGIGTLVLRNNPNSIEWQYNLVSHQEDTYGGRVIQLLGVNITGLTIQAEAGSGGTKYRQQVAFFFRDLLAYQRDTAAPATFSYSARNWSFKVYVLTFSYIRALEEAPSRGFQIEFQVVEELNNDVTKFIMDAELAKLNEGVGWKDSSYSNINFGTKKTTKPATPPKTDPTTPTGPDTSTTGIISTGSDPGPLGWGD